MNLYKGWKQGPDKSTRRLSYYRNMVEKKKTRKTSLHLLHVRATDAGQSSCLFLFYHTSALGQSSCVFSSRSCFHSFYRFIPTSKDFVQKNFTPFDKKTRDFLTSHHPRKARFSIYYQSFINQEIQVDPLWLPMVLQRKIYKVLLIFSCSLGFQRYHYISEIPQTSSTSFEGYLHDLQDVCQSLLMSEGIIACEEVLN